MSTLLTPELTARWDEPDSFTLAAYLRGGGYRGLRKALTRDPKAFRLDVADGMRLIQAKPESYRNDSVVQLGLRIGAARLAQNGDKPTITDTQKLLWDLAMRLESGATSDAERALEQATRRSSA